MRKDRSLLASIVVLFLLSACSVHRHRIGMGPSGVGEETHRQFYLFFGWLRLNDVDTQRFTSDISSYDIVTERTFFDILLTPLFPLVSTRSVTIYR